MEIPCKECPVYAICQHRSIWELSSGCSKFHIYVTIHPDDYSHPWTRTLKSFQEKKVKNE